MPTKDLAVAGEGAETAGTYPGGAGNYTNMNSNDTNTTYLALYDVSVELLHCWDMVSFAEAYTSISKVTFTYVCMRPNAYTAVIRPYVRIGGTNYYGSYAAPLTGDVWETHTYDWAVNPATTNPWTDAEINAAEFGISGGNDWILTTYVLLTVTYLAGWANITKVNGIASASISKVNGITVANIAKINGVAV